MTVTAGQAYIEAMFETDETSWTQYRLKGLDGHLHGAERGEPRLTRWGASKLRNKLHETCGPHTIQVSNVTLYREPWRDGDQSEPEDPWKAEKKARHRASQSRACPSCKAKRGEPCFNLTVFKKRGERVQTELPHPTREVLDEWRPT